MGIRLIVWIAGVMGRGKRTPKMDNAALNMSVAERLRGEMTLSQTQRDREHGYLVDMGMSYHYGSGDGSGN